MRFEPAETFCRPSRVSSKTIPAGNSLSDPSADPSDGAEGSHFCQSLMAPALNVPFRSLRHPLLRPVPAGSRLGCAHPSRGRGPRPAGQGPEPFPGETQGSRTYKGHGWACERTANCRSPKRLSERFKEGNQSLGLKEGTGVCPCSKVARPVEVFWGVGHLRWRPVHPAN